ncbi:MAG: hypothetical protein QM535_07530 [Limnohabitans sp.]|nr:hypothetical protein [Limnohabitans sp.]
MKQITLILILGFTLFSCQKKENVLETEKNALNAVFNEVVDSVYLKLTGSKTIADNVKRKTIVIYDSLTINKPGYIVFKARFNTVKNIFFDTISDAITQKIDLAALETKANFKYVPKLSISRDSIKKSFWNSKTALEGVLLFSKVSFDEFRKFGAFYCTYSEGNIYKAKHFLIYIKKENGNWKLDGVTIRNIIY